MRAAYVAGASEAELLDPNSSAWNAAKPESLVMLGTPVGLQPNEVIRTAWLEKKIGQVEALDASAAHNGELIAFRLDWADETKNVDHGDNSSFPDGAAVALTGKDPLVVPIMTMGAPGLEVNVLQWRADENDVGRQIVAEGVGTSRPVGQGIVKASASWNDGRWTVVLLRALKVETTEPVAQLEPGTTTGVVFAVWEGSSGERGGIKAFSGNWIDLNVEEV